MKNLEIEVSEVEVQKKLQSMILKQTEALQLDVYHKKLKETTKENFIDVPDPVKTFKVIKSMSNEIQISWDEPDCNNSPIVSYNLYLA